MRVNIIKRAVKRAIRFRIHRTVDDVLDSAGLARRRSFRSFRRAIAPAVGLLVAGAAIGAGVGLAFAPQPGMRLRKAGTVALRGGMHRIGKRLGKLPEQTRSVLNSVS